VLNEAIKYAVDAHEGQFRKGGALPYIVHPLHVMNILVEEGVTDERVLSAAVLHDVLEDFGHDDEVHDNFGGDVYGLILHVTKRCTPEKTLSRLADAPAEAQLIKVADIISNTQDGELYPGYRKKKKAQLDVLTKVREHKLYALAYYYVTGEILLPGNVEDY
jgi:guanosine-3',5'-bis(diphosphate) 3'-pyrophosphohydrolase